MGFVVVCVFSFVSHVSCGNPTERKVSAIAGWVQGGSPCRGVQGARSPLLRSFSKLRAETRWEKQPSPSQEGCRDDIPAGGGGGKAPPGLPTQHRDIVCMIRIAASGPGSRVNDPGGVQG